MLLSSTRRTGLIRRAWFISQDPREGSCQPSARTSLDLKREAIPMFKRSIQSSNEACCDSKTLRGRSERCIRAAWQKHIRTTWPPAFKLFNPVTLCVKAGLGEGPGATTKTTTPHANVENKYILTYCFHVFPPGNLGAKNVLLVGSLDFISLLLFLLFLLLFLLVPVSEHYWLFNT